MAATDDLDALRAAIDANRSVLCAALGLRPYGKRFFCPFCQADGNPHADGDLSVEAGFRCHRCGWHGDGFDLVRKVKECDFPSAVDFVQKVYGVSGGNAPVPAVRTNAQRPRNTHPSIDGAVRASAWSLREKTGNEWTRTRCDLYQDAEGRDVAGVVRFDRADGATKADGKPVKEYRPIHAVPGGWQVGDPPGKWPLFRLPELAASSGPIYVCEGEKAACAGAKTGLACTTSAHGARSPGKTDWTPLKGRDIVILPDNDPSGAGADYAEAVAVLAHGSGARSVKIVELPGLPPKGDLADFVEQRSEQSNEAIRAEMGQLAVEPEARIAVEKCRVQGDARLSEGPCIRARLRDILQKRLKATEAHRKCATAVVGWLHDRGNFYYHVQQRDFSGVMFFDSERKLLLPVRGDDFLAWLADVLDLNRKERCFTFIASACETEGLTERATGIEPATYWAATQIAIYLSSGPGRMVRVSPDGVAVVDNGTDEILFPHGATLEPWTLTQPADPFETCALFRDLSTAVPHARDLLRLWVFSLPTDQRTKPPCCVSGDIGSGKTRLVRGIFELYGMPERVCTVHKNGETDFWVAMESGGLACFDNADTRVPWLADALASASTGGTQERRKLYKDCDIVRMRARSWVCVTSASPTFAADAGLADRLLVVRLKRRMGPTAETALSDEIACNRDAALSFIAQTLSLAMADAESVPEGLNARHPDFARFAVRIGRAMGRGKQSIDALRASEADKALFNIENDWIGAALLDLLQTDSFNGSACELLDELKKIEPSLENTLSAKRLGKRLHRLWPHLESVFRARKERDGHAKVLRYTFFPASSAGNAGFEIPFPGKSNAVKNDGGPPTSSSEDPHIPHGPLECPEPTVFEGASDLTDVVQTNEQPHDDRRAGQNGTQRDI